MPPHSDILPRAITVPRASRKHTRRYTPLETHPLSRRDPALAHRLRKALVDEHAVHGTLRSYDTITAKYVEFCTLRDIPPWPVDGIKLGGWIIRLMSSVQPSSLRMYLAAVQFSSVNEGFRWTLQGDETVRRVIRYVKRTFPSGDKAVKLAVTLELLYRALPHLPGWPDGGASYDSMCYDDLLFATASIIGTSAFLRGGEFTFKRGQDRPPLLYKHLRIQETAHGVAVVILVQQAKATWWKEDSYVPVTASADRASPFCPVNLCKALMQRSPFRPHGPKAAQSTDRLHAFHTLEGLPMSREFMVSHTVNLLRTAGVPLRDARGRETAVRSASWRAGGVQSAIAAGLSEQMIMELGRWKSHAWTAYLLFSSANLREASEQMTAAARQSSRVLHTADTPYSPLVGCEVAKADPQTRADDRATAEMVVRRTSSRTSVPSLKVRERS